MKNNNPSTSIIENLSTSQRWAIGILVSIIISIVGWVIQSNISTQIPPPETKTFFYSSLVAEELASQEGIYLAEEIYCKPSNYSWRTDAFRCFADQRSFDPCFKEPIKAEILLCPIDPTTNEVDILTNFFLERQVWSEEYDESRDRNQVPWFVVLEHGEKCGFLGGATYAIADLRANYGCEEGMILFGNPEINDGYWSIKCADQNSINTLIDCSIEEAWF